MINLVLFGPPGAGKGTQSANIIEKYKLVHLSTGDLLRSEIAAGTALGLKAKSLMDQGILVPDEVVIGMIENKLTANQGANGFIFDGFPRTVNQASALDALLQQHQEKISMMIALQVPDDVLLERLLERGKSSGRPDDQNEALIAKRIEEYNAKTAPVAKFYQDQDKYFGINGVGAIEEIFDKICDILARESKTANQ